VCVRACVRVCVCVCMRERKKEILTETVIPVFVKLICFVLYNLVLIKFHLLLTYNQLFHLL